MPDDIPPFDTPDLEAALAELRQSMADLGAVCGIVLNLQRNADRLLVPLRDELLKVQTAIANVLPLLPTGGA
jgi:hypothetical protein